MKIEMDDKTHNLLFGLICMSPIWLPILLAGLYFIIHG